MNTRLLPFFALLLAALLPLQPGCQSTGGAFPAPAAHWETYTGQMHYAGASSIVGDVVVRRSGHDLQLAFSSGPGFPLMRLWVSGSRTKAEGVLARKPWQGWLKLADAFAAVTPAQPVASGSGYRAEGTFSSGRLEHLVVTNTATGERFTFHFSR